MRVMPKIAAALEQPLTADRLPKARSAAYEAPALVRVESAKSLLLGHTYTEQYRDWGGYGTTRYGS